MDRAVAHREKRSSFLIIDALNLEWRELAGQPLAAVNRWASTYPVLTGCKHLDDVLQRVRENPDPVLNALLIEAGWGDELAGRTVLQAMLGKIVRLAWTDPHAYADDYVSAVWCLIRTYPLAARPVRIAANLALDALKSVHEETRNSPRRIDLAPMAPELLVERVQELELAQDLGISDDAPATAAEVIVAAGQLGLIDGQTRDVLLSVYSDGLSGREAADRHRTSPEMIRHRCSKALRRLALHSSALKEAA